MNNVIDLQQVISEFLIERRLPKFYVLQLATKAIKTAYEKTYGNADNCIVHFSMDMTKISVFEEKDNKLVPFDLNKLSQVGIIYAAHEMYDETCPGGTKTEDRLDKVCEYPEHTSHLFHAFESEDDYGSDSWP